MSWRQLNRVLYWFTKQTLHALRIILFCHIHISSYCYAIFTPCNQLALQRAWTFVLERHNEINRFPTLPQYYINLSQNLDRHRRHLPSEMKASIAALLFLVSLSYVIATLTGKDVFLQFTQILSTALIYTAAFQFTSQSLTCEILLYFNVIFLDLEQIDFQFEPSLDTFLSKQILDWCEL